MIHEFYKRNKLRVHEIPVGLKNPVAVGWPSSNKPYEEVESSIDYFRYDKYGWLLDDNHLVIDIDVHNEVENGFKSLADLDRQTGMPLDSVCKAIVNTPSGGRHYYFLKPEGVNLRRSKKDKYPGIDFICNRGKQVVAANSPHPTSPGIYEINDDAELVEIPGAILQVLVKLSDAGRQDESLGSFDSPQQQDRSGDEFNTTENGLEFMAKALYEMGYDVRRIKDCYEFDRPGKSTDSQRSGFLGKKSKQGNYQLTSFSLADSFFPNNQSISIFHAYALLKHNGNHKAASITLRENGFGEDSKIEKIDTDAIGQMVDQWYPTEASENANENTDDEEAFCAAMLPEHGLLRYVYDFYLTQAIKPSPILGLATALSVCQTVFGRRITSHSDLRTNDYNVVLAPTGSGKEACESTAAKLFGEVDPQHKHMMPSDVQSGNGLLAALHSHPVRLWVADEFGKVLSAVLDKRGNQHQKEIGKHLLKLYNKANGFYSGGAHADGVRNAIIQPHLCIFGLTTPGTLAVGSEQLNDGLLGRIAFWPVPRRPKPVKGFEMGEVDKDLVGKLKKWLDYFPGGDLASEFPKPVKLYMTREALDRWEGHQDAVLERMEVESEVRAAIWSRVSGRAMALSLTHRAARMSGPDECQGARVDLMDVNWGVKLSNWLARIACDIVKETIVDNSVSRAKSALLRAVESNGKAYCNDILRANRSLTEGDVASAAKELGMKLVKEPSGGRPRQYYCY